MTNRSPTGRSSGSLPRGFVSGIVARVTTILQAGFPLVTYATSFPANPVDGQQVIRTDLLLGMPFTYESGLAVWLGPIETRSFGEDDTTVNNQYLRHQRASGSSTKGYPIAYDITVVGFSINWTNAIATGSWRMRRDGVNTSVITLGASVEEISDFTLSDAFASGARMTVYADALAGNVNGPSATVYFRRRET